MTEFYAKIIFGSDDGDGCAKYTNLNNYNWMKDKNLFVCAYNVRRGSGTPQSATWGKKQFVDVFRYTAPGPNGYGYYGMPKFIQIITDIKNENILKFVPVQPRHTHKHTTSCVRILLFF